MPARERISGWRPGAGRWRVWLLSAACALASPAAWPEIVTITDYTGGNYSLMLRVGSSGPTVDTVSFDVTGNNIGLTPQPITNTTNTIDVWVAPLRPRLLNETPRPVTLSVNSSAAMTCQTPSSCSGATIPFSKISWTATNNAGAGDIQSGSFSGSAGQQIASFNANATVCNIWILWCWDWNYATRQLDATRLTFTYANDVIYPAGTYSGTVRFTATMQ